MLKLYSHYAEIVSHYADNKITYVQKYNKIRIKARKDTDKIIMLAVFSFLSARIPILSFPYSSSSLPVLLSSFSRIYLFLKRSDQSLYPVNKCFS